MLEPEEFQSRLETFKNVDSQRHDLLKDLYRELAEAQENLKKTRLDLDHQTEARRNMQEQLEEIRKHDKEKDRNPYVVVLIDADSNGYVFQDCLSQGDGKKGERAADKLLAAIKSYLHNEFPGSESWTVLVKAYANVEGLAQFLMRAGKITGGVADLRLFVTEFTSRLVFSDFVDVGHGKERADNKIKESLKFHVDSWQCKQVLLACCYDAGYVSFLGSFAADKRLSSRITILQGDVPFSSLTADFRTLPLSNIFVAKRSLDAVSSSPNPAKAVSAGTNPSPKVNRFGEIQVNQLGKRIDRDLSVDPILLSRLEKSSLCFFYYLRGVCRESKCKRSHQHHSLNDREWDALWLAARKNQCFKAQKVGFCDDALCVYGHR